MNIATKFDLITLNYKTTFVITVFKIHECMQLHFISQYDICVGDWNVHKGVSGWPISIWGKISVGLNRSSVFLQQYTSYSPNLSSQCFRSLSELGHQSFWNSSFCCSCGLHHQTFENLSGFISSFSSFTMMKFLIRPSDSATFAYACPTFLKCHWEKLSTQKSPLLHMFCNLCQRYSGIP